MKNELHRWQSERKKRANALQTELETTAEHLRPLQQQLTDAGVKVEDEQSKISRIKAQIAKNDQRIQELLRVVVAK